MLLVFIKNSHVRHGLTRCDYILTLYVCYNESICSVTDCKIVGRFGKSEQFLGVSRYSVYLDA
jgi:hypothetical protein